MLRAEENPSFLFIVRHGERDISGNITERGAKQMRHMAELITARIVNVRVLIASSPVLWARQSAMILAEELRVLCVVDEVLNAGSSAEDFLVFVEKQTEARSLVVVTHLENAAYFADAYALKKWGADEWPGELKAGEAYLLNTLGRRLDILRNEAS